MFIQTIQNTGEATVLVMSDCLTELLYTITLKPSGPYLVVDNEEIHMSSFLDKLPFCVMVQLFSAMVDVIASVPKVDRTTN